MNVHDMMVVLPFIIFGLISIIALFTFVLIEIEPDPYSNEQKIGKLEDLRETLRPYRKKMWNAIKVMLLIIAVLMIALGYASHNHNAHFHKQNLKNHQNQIRQMEVELDESASDVVSHADSSDFSDVNLGEYPPLFCPPGIIGRDNTGNINSRCTYQKQGI